MSERGTVFVIQDNGTKNLGGALKFGEIEVLQRFDLPLHQDPAPTVVELRDKLKDYNSEKDWVLLTGDPVLIGIVFHVIGARSKIIRCLKWDRQRTEYFPIILNLN